MIKPISSFLTGFVLLTATAPAYAIATPISLIHSPVTNPIMTSGYGMRVHPITGKPGFHAAIDLRAKFNQPVESVFAGVVEKAGPRGLLGNAVEVFHPQQQITTIYGHLNRVTVKPGERLSMGGEVGLAGSTGRSTGVHVHLIVKEGRNGKPINPIVALNDSRVPHITEVTRQSAPAEQVEKIMRTVVEPITINLMQAFAGPQT